MTLQTIAGLIGLIPYIMLIIGILKSNVRQSFAAFLLWGMLDAIAFVTSLMQHGNYWLSLANAIGATTIAIILLIKGQASWSKTESITALLVVICLIIWYFSNEHNGLIASSLAVVLASIPQMAETYRNPKSTPLVTYLIFLIANLISLYAGNSWTVEERLYAAGSVFLTAVIVILRLVVKSDKGRMAT